MSGGSRSWIACFRHALFVIDRSALPGCRRQACIRSDLASIVEVSEKSFRPEDGGEVRSDALDGEQHGRRRRCDNLLRGKQRVPLCLHRLDLLEQQFEPIELTADLSLQMLWQGTTIARPQFVEPSPTVTMQRFVPAHTLREQQSFNAIDVPDSLGDEDVAFAAETATILFLGSRRLDHCAHSGFAALVRQQRANQRLTVDLVSFRPPAPTGCRN